jgi:PDZ domain-containing protein, putative
LSFFGVVKKKLTMDTFDLPKDCPKPRLCHLIKWPNFNGYGFNLHAEKLKLGQYIGKVDDNSPAYFAGLREGDRIIEVNGVNIANENHKQVVERIKSSPNETKLLVLDEASDKWYKDKKIIVKSNQFNVIYMKTPSSRPSSNDNAFNESKENLKTNEDVLNNNNNINNNYVQKKLNQKNEKNVKKENANCDQLATTPVRKFYSSTSL